MTSKPPIKKDKMYRLNRSANEFTSIKTGNEWRMGCPSDVIDLVKNTVDEWVSEWVKDYIFVCEDVFALGVAALAAVGADGINDAPNDESGDHKN